MKLKRSLVFFLLLVAAFALVGCAGEEGLPGAQGAQGEMGDKGPQGDQGLPGVDGAQGVKGDKGAKGEKGEKGDKGEDGVEVEFRVYNGVLQQKYTNEDDTKWRDVFFFNQIANWAKQYTITFDVDGGELAEDTMTGIIYQSEVTLPVPTKEGFTFLGWVQGETVYTDKVKVEKDLSLKATWEVSKYTIVLQGEGDFPGSNSYASIQEFADEIVALFNATGASDAVVTEQNDFTGTTHPNVKYVFGNADNLAKYKWFIQYILDELTAFCEANGIADSAMMTTYNNIEQTKKMLTDMINGDTTAISGSYIDSRTWFRQWIHRLINAENAEAGTGNTYYNQWSIDYASNPEKVAEFLTIANGGEDTKYTHGDPLPIPVLEGKFFDGWYDEDGNKVEYATKDCTLTAKWINAEDIELEVTFDLADGQWAEGYTLPEKITAAFELPTPVKEGYTFLGWYDAEDNKVTKLTENVALAAKWEITVFTVALNANGGLIKEATLQDFTNDLIALFNSTGASDAVTTDQNNFAGTTHPNVKYVFSNAENLANLKWFLEFAKAEIAEAVVANGVAETKMISGGTGNEFVAWIDAMINGDTAAINDATYGAGYRTAFRQYIHRLINAQNPAANAGKTSYNQYTVDYANNPEKVAAFLAIIPGGKETSTLNITMFDSLPTPVKAGFEFAGWYNGETLVEKVTADCELVAKWNLAVSFTVAPTIDQLVRIELATQGDLSQFDVVYYEVNGTKVFADKDGKFVFTGFIQDIVSTYEAKLVLVQGGEVLETQSVTYSFPVLEGEAPTYEVPATDVVENATAEFKNRSLVVDGTLAVKYTFTAPETAKVVFKDVATGLVYREYNVNTLEKDEEGNYVVKLVVPANEWGVVLSATVCDQDGVALSNTNYLSVIAAMCAIINANTESANRIKTYRTLVKYYLG